MDANEPLMIVLVVFLLGATPSLAISNEARPGPDSCSVFLWFQEHEVGLRRAAVVRDPTAIG